MRLKVYAEFDGKYKAFSPTQKAAIAAVLDEWDAALKAADATKKLTAAKEQALTAYNESLKLQGYSTVETYKAVDALEEQIARQLEQNETLGKTKAELERLAISKINDALLTAEQNLQNELAAREIIPANVDAIAQQVEALRRLKKAKEEGITKELAQETTEEWVKTADTIYTGVVDSLMRGAESGKSIFESLTATLKGMFSSLVLQPTIKAVMGSIGGTLAAGLANAAGPGAPAVSGANGLGSLGTVASSLFGAGGLGGSLAAGAGWLTGATTLTGSLGAAGSLIGTGSLGGIASGLGMAAGALGPIAIGLALASSLFGKKGGGPKDSGSAGIGSAYRVYDSGALDEALGSVLGATNSSYAQIAAALGVDQKTIGDTQFGYYAAKDPRGSALTQLVVESKVGGQQTYFRNGENVGRSDADLEKAIADSTAQAVLATLKASGIDTDAAAYLEANAALTGTADGINKLLTTLTEVKGAFADIDTLGGVFARVGALSIDAKSQLLAFSGGVEQFLQNTRSFVDQYFNDAEKSAITAAAIVERLANAGIQADLTTKESLRDLVEATDVSTESGRQQLAVLLDVADDFASISGYLESQGQTLNELALLAPKNDLIASLTEQSVEAQRDAGEALTRLDDTTLEVGNVITQAIKDEGAANTGRLESAISGLVDAVQSLEARVVEQSTDAATLGTTTISGLVNLRKTFEDVIVGNSLRVAVVP